ncbi:UDP-glucose 4-epimerase/long-chain acyl-CoA synthetase [Nitrosomonas sp. Nm51]|uniref:SDR family oxidoreductase n=1 Tax=Nitrosomonas sp. Nm51 TaxID=133720 RepID=UPI0008AE5690|nr:SDR family oxidoreductase [Nitrosomonas sp. Nm51]SER34436.1 UDP-glucose 4-epimerase/long-chain acyl-CoA synthetase [Nitrosomonas sp. Nm51]
MNTYFVTGATGALGSAIVEEIIKKTTDKLIVLIRAKDEFTLQERVRWLFSFLDIDSSKMTGRVDFVRGDTEQVNFGLDLHEYGHLSAVVTHIIHSAASVRMNLSIKNARLASVVATENILELARLCKQNGILQKVELISTVGVGGRWQGPLPEEWINQPRIFHNTYEQSKAEAEAIIEQEVKKGLPLTLHRPSMIVGHSQTGRIPYFQIFYHLIEFVVGRRTRGLLPDLSQRHVDLVPVDYVAKVIIWSSLTSKTTGKILHLCAGPEFSVPLEKLKVMAQKKFRAQNISVPNNITLPTFLLNAIIKLTAFISLRRKKQSAKMLFIFMDYLSENQEFANIDTLHLIQSSGIKFPIADEFLDPVIDYYLQQTYSLPNNSAG